MFYILLRIFLPYNYKISLLQCDVVDISDDEDTFLMQNDAGVIPKDENLDYDLPPEDTFSMPREVWFFQIKYSKFVNHWGKSSLAQV